jgi:hypothetical protein
MSNLVLEVPLRCDRMDYLMHYVSLAQVSLS